MDYKDEMKIDNFTWNYMINAGYREIADDEIVLNKKDYEKLCHLAYFGYEDVKQETAREVMQEIKKEIEDIGDWQPVYDEIFARIANRIRRNEQEGKR